MTKFKGFKKNRFESKIPMVYEVRFESGHIEEVMATSARDAEIKTMQLQSIHGFYKGRVKKNPYLKYWFQLNAPITTVT